MLAIIQKGIMPFWITHNTYGKQLYKKHNREEWDECDYNEEIDKKDPYDDSLPLSIIEYRIKLDMIKNKHKNWLIHLKYI